MDSEANSSFTRSATQDTHETQGSSRHQVNRRGRTAHNLYVHTRPGQVKDGEDPKDSYCIYCTGEGEEVYFSSVTTNLKRHLKKHNIHIESIPSSIQQAISDQLQQLYLQAESCGETSALENQIFRKYLNQDAINEALVSLIVVRNLSFRTVEWPEFHALCQLLNPQCAGIITTAHSQITKKVDVSWNTHKDVVRRLVQSAVSRIHIALDVWTSPNRLLLLGIVCHTTDYNEKHRKALLALRPIVNHSGVEQFNVLLPVLKDYGIVRKLGAVVSDNASTNDTLCSAIQDYMYDKEDIDWKASRWRIRCTGHIINLAVQAFLFQSILSIEELQSYDEQESLGELGDEEERRVKFRLMGPLGQLHNIIVHIRGSTARIKEFLWHAERIAPLDNRTRWNSWYRMLEIGLKLESAIDAYTKSHLDTLEKDYLTPQNWKRLRTIMEFLEPFNRATLATQGDNSSIDKVLFTMDILIQWFEASHATYASDKDFAARIKKSWQVFDKYYSRTDSSPLYAAALILHPNRRTKYIYVNWKKQWVKPALKKVGELWEEYRINALTPAVTSSSYDNPYREPEPEKELDAFDKIAKKLTNYTRPSSQDEFQDYCDGEPYDIGKMSAHDWWCQDTQRTRWPRLSHMAIDILSIPAMSDEPERVFSGARRTVSWERGQMGAENLEKVECLKHWKRSGILNES